MESPSEAAFSVVVPASSAVPAPSAVRAFPALASAADAPFAAAETAGPVAVDVAAAAAPSAVDCAFVVSAGDASSLASSAAHELTPYRPCLPLNQDQE